MVKVNPDDLEEAGSVHLKALANEYDDILEGVALTTQNRNEAFFSAGKPSAGTQATPVHPRATASAQQSGALLAAFDEAYEMFYTVVYHTAINIRAMGDALVAAAGDHRVTDGEIEASFKEQEAEVRGGGDAEHADGDEAPLAPEKKDEAADYYDGELGG
jgi:hypothetical protein